MTLPIILSKKFQEWKNSNFDNNKSQYKKISKEKQKPLAMIISCCDSRVQPTSFFKAEIGELFIHKNIANLIPSYEQNNNENSTFAALEYAVQELEIPNIIIIGHSNCGGIKYAFDKFSGDKSNSKFNFLNNWIEIIEPAYKKLNINDPQDIKIRKLEKLSIQNSIKNLISLPFVKMAINNEKIKIHGLWYDISTADLYNYDFKIDKFIKIF